MTPRRPGGPDDEWDQERQEEALLSDGEPFDGERIVHYEDEEE